VIPKKKACLKETRFCFISQPPLVPASQLRPAGLDVVSPAGLLLGPEREVAAKIITRHYGQMLLIILPAHLPLGQREGPFAFIRNCGKSIAKPTNQIIWNIDYLADRDSKFRY
jgi:hypothetical protein